MTMAEKLKKVNFEKLLKQWGANYAYLLSNEMNAEIIVEMKSSLPDISRIKFVRKYLRISTF